MTDNDIIKALESYTWAKLYHEKGKLPKLDLGEVLDLINRQKAEIERLEKVQVQYVKAYFDEFAERLKNDFRLAQLDIGLTSAVIDELVETMKNEFSTLADFTDLIKAEAVKEFAKFLVDKAENGVISIVDLPDYTREWMVKADESGFNLNTA